MRLTILATSLFAFTAAAAAAAEPAANSHFAPLDFLVGHCWQATFENGQRDVQCYERLYDGKFVQSTHTVIGSEPQYGGVTFFSWDGDRQRIRFHYFTSTGALSEGYFVPGVDGIVIPERHVGQDGKVIELESRYQPEGTYGYRVVTREKTGDGWVERMNLHYRRADAPELPKEQAAVKHDGADWRLAWSSNRDGNWEVYRQEADGSQRNLTTRASNEWAWNVRGDDLLLLTTERADSEAKGWRGARLHDARLDRISDEVVADGYVDCTADGTRCAGEVRIDGRKRIAFFDQDGRRTGLLAGGEAGEDADPQFTPDGNGLLFRSSRSGHWELYLGDANGGTPKLLTFHPGNDGVSHNEYGGEGPAHFSPDGRRIVWMRKFPDSGYDVWAMDADGSDSENLTETQAGNDGYPSFSPDGKWIAFDSSRDGNNEIYVMDAGGGDVRRITTTPGADLAPLWVRMPAEDAKQ